MVFFFFFFLFFLFSLYSNPGGMPPYASQGFPFLPPYPPQEANRTITSLSVADTISSSTTSYTPAKPAAPSFGVLSNLPLPVPTTDTSAPVSIFNFYIFVSLKIHPIDIYLLYAFSCQPLSNAQNIKILNHIFNSNKNLRGDQQIIK